MQAAILYGPRDVRIETVPDPVAGPAHVLVRVRSVSICPSDWRLWDSGDAGGAPLGAPIIQGHEFAGDVVSLGEGVDRVGLGERVAVEPSWHCGHCDTCLTGREHLCRNILFPSFPPTDGGLAELVACPATAVRRMPEGLSYDEGALTEPLGVALHAVRLAFPTVAFTDPGAGSLPPVAVLGAGVIGLCVTKLCRLAGVKDVTVVEPIRGRREIAWEWGATRVAESAAQLAREGFEADALFECSGESGAAAEAMPLVAPSGRLMVIGIPHPETVQFEANVPRRRELTITFTRRSRDALKEALELAFSGKVDLRALPARHFALAQTDEAIRLTGERPGSMLRAIVHP